MSAASVRDDFFLARDARPDQWTAIWSDGVAVLTSGAMTDPTPKAALSLCLEFNLPPVGSKKPVRLWQGAADPNRAIALYAQADGALRLVHKETDLKTPPGFVRTGETVSLRYRSCAKGRGDIVDFTNHDSGSRLRLRAGLACAARLDEALPRDPGFLRVCHVAAIAEFGLAPSDLPAIAAGAFLPTNLGPVPVEALRPGMLLKMVDGGLKPLRWTQRRSRLCLGRLGPVWLRAPYFGLANDVCVTPATRVMRSGPAVEYIFGTEQVLIRASDMLSSPGALRDHRHPVRDMYHLMMDDHGCVAIDRCGIETALLSDVVAAEDGGPPRNLSQSDCKPCLPVLDRAGAQALMAATPGARRTLG